jgi:hypothetical protein
VCSSDLGNGAASESGNFEIYDATTGNNFSLTRSGNLGLGVTPSAWTLTSAKAIQVGPYAALTSNTNGGAFTDLGHNMFGGYSYLTTNAASFYRQGGGAHQWFTAPSGTAGDAISFSQSMTLDASGNLSLGTTSAIGRLAVVGDYAFFRENTAGADVYIRGYYGNANVAAIQVVSNSPLAFLTNNAERARITSGGDFLVACTSNPSSTVPGARIGPNGPNGVQLDLSNDITGTYEGLARFINGNGVVGQINTSGSATTYATSSDYRLKNITGPITTSGAYIDSLNPVEGTWKADGSTFVGLIAHEVQEASRTHVATGVKDGEQMQGMDYSSAEIIANLIAEVKSLRARLAAANI